MKNSAWERSVGMASSECEVVLALVMAFPLPLLLPPTLEPMLRLAVVIMSAVEIVGTSSGSNVEARVRLVYDIDNNLRVEKLYAIIL